MNTKFIAVGMLSLTLLLSACTKEENQVIPAKEITETEETEKENNWETQVGDDVELTLVAKNVEVETIQTGPIHINIPQVNVTYAKHNQALKDILKKDEGSYIQIDFELENISDETISINPDKATIITNTGEQLDSHLLLSDNIGGDFIRKVKKEGSVYFFLENSKAEDIKWIRLMIDAPYNEDSESVGEKVDTKIQFKEKEVAQVVVNLYTNMDTWEFVYPNHGNITSQELVIPINEKVYFNLMPSDDSHSFWIPAIGGKMDTNTEKLNNFWLKFDEEKANEEGGVFYAKCAEHGSMEDFNVKAVPRDEFNQWIKEIKN
jgi:heme/copper-type cytochrome/quinol oxidase subunit 2